MLAADPRIDSLDSRHLRNWWLLAAPERLSRETRYGLLVLKDGRPLHALILGEGAIDLETVPFHGTSRPQLRALCHAMNVAGLLVLEHDALARLLGTIEQVLRLDDDLPRQGVSLWQALRHCENLWLEPPLLDLIPPLRSETLQKTFNLLVPDQSSLLTYVIDETYKQVHCSVLALKREGSIQRVHMHPLLRDQVTERELCRDWRSNYPRINQAAESRLGPPCISVFVELEAVQRILQGPADQLAREIKARNLVIDPAPVWLQGLLGGAAVAAVASRGAKRVARFLPEGARKMAGEMAGIAQERMKESAANPFAMLGFDPIELLQTLRGFYSSR